MRLAILAAFLSTFCLISNAQSIWPSLPTSGFVSGRTATLADVKNGNAGFSIDADRGVGSKHLPIEIPQYAYFNHKGEIVQVVLIQAEEVREIRIASGRKANCEIVVGPLSDFTLLGIQRPAHDLANETCSANR